MLVLAALPLGLRWLKHGLRSQLAVEKLSGTVTPRAGGEKQGDASPQLFDNRNAPLQAAAGSAVVRRDGIRFGSPHRAVALRHSAICLRHALRHGAPRLYFASFRLWWPHNSIPKNAHTFTYCTAYWHCF